MPIRMQYVNLAMRAFARASHVTYSNTSPNTGAVGAVRTANNGTQATFGTCSIANPDTHPDPNTDTDEDFVLPVRSQMREQ